jgi:hypothetical protein
MEYIHNTLQQFRYYQKLGQACLDQLSEEELFYQVNETSNSVAVIINHIQGNILSRWTNFLEEDGEKDWRNRDMEFEQPIRDKEALQKSWNTGWDCFFNALEPIRDEDLENIIYIRNQGHTILEAINRQLAHYAYHIGQMVFLSKMIKGDAWKSLSIPKNKSGDYNSTMFSKDKQKGHFTSELLSDDKN